jgi:hypothetical protein
VTGPAVFDLIESPDEAPARRRMRPVLVVLVVVVVVAALVGLRVSQRPTGWVAQQSRYATAQKVAVAGLRACVQVELTGNLKYERSTAAKAGDRHFRNLLITDATMEVLYYASCTRGADLIKLSHVHIAQAWATTGGRALGRRATTYASPNMGGNQYNSGVPIEAHGVTARGRVCVTVSPSLIARAGQKESTAPLHPVTVCGH